MATTSTAMKSGNDIEAQIQEPQSTSSYLPVLIVPGFMSSGMECEESAVDESWIGKRIWINLQALGFESLHTGSTLEQNEEMKEADEDYDEEMHQKYKEQVKCRNIWVQHISLSSDMKTERPGMKVRPIPGLAGVDYLTPGALTNLVSYVFGPVIDALKKVGYEEGVNLDAVSYDWRLPPSVLEERDGYFTNTMRKVEEMYEKNNETPVVLLGHSLGCRTAHYFLNFAKQAPSGGQDWIDKYVHTYLPVGAPHLGAPKALRGFVTGDKMGLDTFLTDEEGLTIGRSFGSGAWLLPNKVPSGATASAFIRREGVLQVTLSPIECKNLFIGRSGRPPRIRVAISVDGETCTSEYQRPEGENAVVSFSKPFNIMIPLGKGETKLSGSLILTIQEKGFRYAKKDAKVKGGCFYSWWFLPFRILICFILHMVLLPCMVIYWLVWIPAVKAASEAAKKAGACTTLATSRTVNLPEETDGTLDLLVVHEKEFQDQACCSDAPVVSRMTDAKLSFRWSPPPDSDEIMAASRGADSIIASPEGENQPHFFDKKRKEDTYYYPISGDQFLKREGLQDVLDLVKNTYFPDPIKPRWTSSTEAPPVKRVKAVYGINVPSEIGGIYRRKSIIPREGRLEAIHELDTSVNVDEEEKGHYAVKKGIIYETKNAPQIVAGEKSSAMIHSSARFTASEGKIEVLEGKDKVIHRSGDGTVPYWSLQQCRAWHEKCEVMIDEIDGADHREILADKRFHAILIDYVTQGTAPLSSSWIDSTRSSSGKK